MWERNLVSRLTPKASQVLLSLILCRSTEVQLSSAEFASLTGLGQRSIGPALSELRDSGLVEIIAQPGKPYKVRLVVPEGVQHETTVDEVGVEGIETYVEAVLQAPGAGDRAGGENTPKGSREEDRGNSEGGAGTGLAAPGERALLQRSNSVESELLANCLLADQSEDKLLCVAALRDVWDYAFPERDYPVQRLTNDAAKRLLGGRTAEWVGRVILDAKHNARSKISSPLAYVKAAIENEERHNARPIKEAGPVITDDVRRLVAMGKEQFGGEKAKEREGHQPGAT